MAVKAHSRQQVCLFVADRPFNILTHEEGSPLPFDNMTADMAAGITAAEKAIASNECRFLSRVSFKSEQDWVQAYEKQNLHRQRPLHVVSDGNSCRGHRFTGGDQMSTFT